MSLDLSPQALGIDPQSGQATGVNPSQSQGIFSKIGGFLSGAVKDVANTLLVTPAARATEAATRLFAPNSQAAQGYNAMADAGQGQSFPSPLGNIDVPAQKAFGQGGAEQIGGQALKSASYLAPAVGAEGIASNGIGSGIVQGAKLGAVSGALGGAGQAMEQGQGSGDVIGNSLQGGLIGAGVGGLAAGVAGAFTPKPELYTENPIFKSSYDANVANATQANNMAGTAATDSIHEASSTVNDMMLGAGNQYDQAPNIISKADPSAGTVASTDLLTKMQELKDTKAWALPPSVRDAIPNDINKPVKFTPQQSQDIVKSLNDLKFNSKGDVVINQQTSNLVDEFKSAAQAGMGHVTNAQGNSVWSDMSQQYQQASDARDALSKIIPIKKFQNEILDPTEVNNSTDKMLEMLKTPQGTSALMRTNAEIKANTGYDILNDPMGAINKLAESNADIAKALKGNFGHQFVQGLKNPQALSRRTLMVGAGAVTALLGIVAVSTAFRKQIESALSNQ